MTNPMPPNGRSRDGSPLLGLPKITDGKVPLPDMVGAAAVRERQPSTAASQEQVRLVIELEALSREIAEHDRRVMEGGAVDWATVAERLGRAARECHRQAAPHVIDIGDAGGR